MKVWDTHHSLNQGLRQVVAIDLGCGRVGVVRRETDTKPKYVLELGQYAKTEDEAVRKVKRMIDAKLRKLEIQRQELMNMYRDLRRYEIEAGTP